jgi:hypothetical protein
MTTKPNQVDDSVVQTIVSPHQHQPSRRKFLATAGGFSLLSAFVIGSASSCKKSSSSNGVDLGSGDIGILNYAYALEQLEAAFYVKVVASPYGSMPAAEASYLTDIRDHEVAHREFFKAALGSNAIPALEVNFSTIDFTSRASVLGTAKAFEDLGVTAYNGAGQLLQDAGYLTIAGKIVSVEARHAALIRDLITPGSFADNTALDANAMDMARTPAQVLAIAGAYISTQIDASHLPS